MKGLNLWSSSEAERLAKLALSYPELLTYDEQVLWRLIDKYQYIFWYGKDERTLKNINTFALDHYWEHLKRASEGDEESLRVLEVNEQAIFEKGISPFYPSS